MDTAHIGVAARHVLDHGGGAVRGVVVDDDKFEGNFAQRGGDLVVKGRDVVAFLVARHDDGQLRGVPDLLRSQGLRVELDGHVTVPVMVLLPNISRPLQSASARIVPASGRLAATRPPAPTWPVPSRVSPRSKS